MLGYVAIEVDAAAATRPGTVVIVECHGVTGNLFGLQRGYLDLCRSEASNWSKKTAIVAFGVDLTKELDESWGCSDDYI